MVLSHQRNKTEQHNKNKQTLSRRILWFQTVQTFFLISEKITNELFPSRKTETYSGDGWRGKTAMSNFCFDAVLRDANGTKTNWIIAFLSIIWRYESVEAHILEKRSDSNNKLTYKFLDWCHFISELTSILTHKLSHTVTTEPLVFNMFS